MTKMLNGYGIFNGKTALEYVTSLPIAKKKAPSHFSHWSFSHFKECQLRYAWLIVDKKPLPEPENKRGTLEGGAMHLAIEQLLRDRPDDIVEWCTVNARPYFERYLFEIRDGMEWKSKKDPEEAYEKYLKLVVRACTYVKKRVFNDPTVLEALPEVAFLTDVGNGITIGGRMDLILVRKAEDGRRFLDIVDWKGTTKEGSVSKEQLMFYGLGGMSLLKTPVRFVSFVFPYLNKESLFHFVDSDYEQFLFTIKGMAEKQTGGERQPTKDSSKCKWCVYRTDCPDRPEKGVTGSL